MFKQLSGATEGESSTDPPEKPVWLIPGVGDGGGFLWPRRAIPHVPRPGSNHGEARWNPQPQDDEKEKDGRFGSTNPTTNTLSTAELARRAAQRQGGGVMVHGRTGAERREASGHTFLDLARKWEPSIAGALLPESPFGFKDAGGYAPTEEEKRLIRAPDSVPRTEEQKRATDIPEHGGKASVHLPQPKYKG